MLTEQEIINNAFKELILLEELTAEKYNMIAQQITKPPLQNTLNNMEMNARNNLSMLLSKSK